MATYPIGVILSYYISVNYLDAKNFEVNGKQ